MTLLKSNFQTKQQVEAETTPPDNTAQYEKKALENISGSMVFVERKRLLWDKK